MLGLCGRKRSRACALSPAQSGTCVKSLTIAMASASRPAGLVTYKEYESQSELWMLKSPRTMISERGDCRVMVSIDLENW